MPSIPLITLETIQARLTEPPGGHMLCFFQTMPLASCSSRI